MYLDFIMAGFGGQGVMFIGNLLAEAAMREGKNITFVPSYGPEMRGGTANCTVVVSDDEIGSPLIYSPLVVLAMNKPSLDKFGPRLKKEGFLFLNSSMISEKDSHYPEHKVLSLPALELAKESTGNTKLANMVMFGALCSKTEVVGLNSIEKALHETLPKRTKPLIPANLKAFEAGFAYRS